MRRLQWAGEKTKGGGWVYSGVARVNGRGRDLLELEAQRQYWKRVRRVRVRAAIRRLRNNVKVLLKGELGLQVELADVDVRHHAEHIEHCR